MEGRTESRKKFDELSVELKAKKLSFPKYASPTAAMEAGLRFAKVRKLIGLAICEEYGDHSLAHLLSPFKRKPEVRELRKSLRNFGRDFRDTFGDMSLDEAKEVVVHVEDALASAPALLPLVAHVQWVLNVLAENPFESIDRFEAALPPDLVARLDASPDLGVLELRVCLPPDLLKAHQFACAAIGFMLGVEGLAKFGKDVSEFDEDATAKISKAVGNLCAIVESAKPAMAALRNEFVKVTRPPVQLLGSVAQSWHELAIQLADRFLQRVWAKVHPLESICFMSISGGTRFEPYRLQTAWPTLAPAIAKLPDREELELFLQHLQAEIRLTWHQRAPEPAKEGGGGKSQPADAANETRQQISDGPLPPNLFFWRGRTAELGRTTYKLIAFLWNQENRMATTDDACVAVWDDEEKANRALPSAMTRAHAEFEKNEIPVRITKKSGYVALNVGES